jgi:hypothetical protein
MSKKLVVDNYNIIKLFNDDDNEKKKLSRTLVPNIKIIIIVKSSVGGIYMDSILLQNMFLKILSNVEIKIIYLDKMKMQHIYFISNTLIMMQLKK